MPESAVLMIGEAGADAERLDLLAGYLRSELESLDGVTVGRDTGSPAPPGARGLDLIAADGLVVGLARSDALRGVTTRFGTGCTAARRQPGSSGSRSAVTCWNCRTRPPSPNRIWSRCS